MPSDSPAHDPPPPGRLPESDPAWSELPVAAPVSPELGMNARETPRPARSRRRALPVALFFATALSLVWTGSLQWMPLEFLVNYASIPGASSYVLDSPGMAIRREILVHWPDGLIYMACLVAILMTHEMGHFLMTVRHRIAASLPFFIPMPISQFGTLGAVIGMDGLRANRKEIFDIGLAGPLAGLVVCVPVLWVGISRLDLSVPGSGPYALDLPLILRWVLAWIQPAGYSGDGHLAHSHLNPYFMAGWVGLLVTGLNMLPVSQLDGGHVIYSLFGPRGNWIARLFLVLAIAFIVYFELASWSVMAFLVLLMGPDHPPTRDDTVRLGPIRIVLGWISLLIPVLCFPPAAIHILP